MDRIVSIRACLQRKIRYSSMILKREQNCSALLMAPEILEEKIKALRKLDDQLSDVPDSIDLEMHYYLLCYLHKLSLAEKGNTDTRDENMAALYN